MKISELFNRYVSTTERYQSNHLEDLTEQLNQYFTIEEQKKINNCYFVCMKAETLKLGLIERLMKLQKVSALERVEKSITLVEMEARAEESMEAVRKGETLSIAEFKSENRKWARERYTR